MGGKCIWVLLLAWAFVGPLAAEDPAQESGGAEVRLRGSLNAVTFEYALGSRLHRAHVTEPEVLTAMASALRIVAQAPDGPEPTRSKVLGHIPVMILDLGQDRRYSFSIAGRNQLHSKEWGRLTLAPDFFQVVETWISELEQSRVRLNVENPFPEDRLEKLRAFQELDDRPWQEAQIVGPRRRVWVHGPQALKELQEGFQGIYVPSSSVAGDSWGYSVELRSWVGESVGFTLVDATRCPTRPLHAVLLRHETLGTVWVDDAFRDVLLELHSPSFPVHEGAQDSHSLGLQDVRKAAEALLQGPSQVLLYRGALPGEPGQQHVWPIQQREILASLQGILLPSNLRLQRAIMPQLRAAWSQRAIDLGSLSWLDDAGQRWTIYQGSSTLSWLPPLAEWEGLQSLWVVLQENVR